MNKSLTLELLAHLKNKGYTFLISEKDDGSGDCIFIPTKWDVEEFMNDTSNYGYEDDEILCIDEALKYLDDNDLPECTVILP